MSDSRSRPVGGRSLGNSAPAEVSRPAVPQPRADGISTQSLSETADQLACEYGWHELARKIAELCIDDEMRAYARKIIIDGERYLDVLIPLGYWSRDYAVRASFSQNECSGVVCGQRWKAYGVSLAWQVAVAPREAPPRMRAASPWPEEKMREAIAACELRNRDLAWREIFRPRHSEHGWDNEAFRLLWSDARGTRGMTGRPAKRAD